MDNTIPNQDEHPSFRTIHEAILQTFDTLIYSLDVEDIDPTPTTSRPFLEDERGRFRVWSMNVDIGSLEWRLSQAPHVSGTLRKLLGNLQSYLSQGKFFSTSTRLVYFKKAPYVF